MNHIFISYRRDDAGYATGRINDRLREKYGKDALFMDVDNIPVGVDFRFHLDEQVSRCNVLLAVIGKKWLTVKNKRRLDDSTDFLRIEIESALKRNIRIVPLLVQGAKMPSPENLPDSIQALAFRQGIAIRGDPDFHRDMDRLIADVSEHLKQLEDEEQCEAKKSTEAKPDAAAKRKADDAERQKTTAKVKRKAEEERKAQLVAETRRKEETAESKPKAEQIERKKAAGKHLKAKRKRQTEQEKRQSAEASTNRKSNQPDDMVLVPAGKFTMGTRFKIFQDDYEREATPSHEVSLDEFLMDICSVTVEKYEMFLQASHRDEPPKWASQRGRPKRPVVFVTWADAVAYATWAGKRLPTEAEREYAARGRLEEKKYPWGNDDPDGRANYGRVWSLITWRQADKHLVDVGGYSPNGYGLHDMAGNVAEWCQDWYGMNYYNNSPSRNPKGPSSGNKRATRGVGWNGGKNEISCWARRPFDPSMRFASIGFRCVKDHSASP